jgi:hypothetical protein
MPRPNKTLQNNDLLEAALAGLQLRKLQIDEQIQEVRALLGKSDGRRGRPPGAAKQGRLSVAARKRIAAAQKRRWAEYRKSAAKAE